MEYKNHEFYLRRAIEVSKIAREGGNTPFGALLVDADGNILMEQGNVEITEHRCTGHAEAALAERASKESQRVFMDLYFIHYSRTMCNVLLGQYIGQT